MSNPLLTEEDIKITICVCGSNGNRLIPKGLPHTECVIAKGDSATFIHLSDCIRNIIKHWWQCIRKRTGAWLIAFSWHSHIQSLMWTHQVICLSPVIEEHLACRQVREAVSTDEFCIKRSMQAFVLTLSLRMVWSTMTDTYTQPNQPRCQTCVWVICIISPGRAIVHEHSVGHSIASEYGCQLILDSFMSLIWTCSQTHQKAGAVIQYSQGMKIPTFRQWEVSLEVHLPQFIGILLLESLKSPMLQRLFRINVSMSSQDGCNGTWAGNINIAILEQKPADLASTPCWILAPNLQHSFRHFRRCAIGTGMWTTGLIHQRFLSAMAISLKPFIACLTAYTEASAQFTHISTFLCGKLHEIQSQRRNTHFLPGHLCHLFRFILMPLLVVGSVTYVSEHLLPMSPVCTDGGRLGWG